MPASEPVETPRPATYVVRDAAGTIVDLSQWETEPESPAMHAEDYLYWLVNKEALAGQYILEKVLKKLYTSEFCREENIRPLPWSSVLRKLGKLIGGPKTYRSVFKGGRRRRLRVYRVPLAKEMAARLTGADQ